MEIQTACLLHQWEPTELIHLLTDLESKEPKEKQEQIKLIEMDENMRD